MKTNTIIRISGMILLALVVSIAVIALVYALQAPNLPGDLATIGWNGEVIL